MTAHLTRREALKLLGGVTGLGILSACSSPTPATPAKPAEPKPAETKPTETKPAAPAAKPACCNDSHPKGCGCQ